MEFFYNSGIDNYILEILSANLLIFLLVISSIIFIYKFIKRDENYIVISSLIFASSVIITSTGSTEIIDNLLNEFSSNLRITLYGLLLLIMSKLIFEKIYFRKINEKDNYSKNIIVASIFIANSILIRSLIVWMDSVSLEGFKLIFIIYILYEILYVIFNLLYLHIYSNCNSFNKITASKNLSSAISYFGYRVGLSLAISSTCIFVPYDIITDNIIFEWIEFTLIIAGLYMIAALTLSKMIKNILKDYSSIERSVIESSAWISMSLLIASLIW